MGILNKNKFIPELVSPAGDWSGLHSAVDAGCDSVYFGIKDLNMRNLAVNFDMLELKKIMDFLHSRGKKGYLALNVIVYEKELKKIDRILHQAKKARVDGVILWDMAIFSQALAVGLPVHLSTQASVANTEALEFFSKLGARRIVLARECTLSDLKNIVLRLKKKNISCEIETFIHGAMCVSISGRCFLSSYSFGKSANRGECIQPCRREFFIEDTRGDTRYRLGKDYLLSPKDLCTIDFLDSIVHTGVRALKIEGRIRSAEYIGIVTATYRKALQAIAGDQFTASLKETLKNDLKKVYNRGFSHGFYFGSPQESPSRFLENQYEKIYVGEVIKFYKKIKVAHIRVHDHPLKTGQEIVLIGKDTPARFARAEELQINHTYVSRAGRGQQVGIKLPFTVKPKDKLFIWRKKNIVQSP
ncbi:MAG: U32 family peptidase [Candidatus Omnitrophica bacterium]|nr:U32 family peptidase [Candidatus Omnitrophota bacterium]